jgi:hypothetical protein
LPWASGRSRNITMCLTIGPCNLPRPAAEVTGYGNSARLSMTG